MMKIFGSFILFLTLIFSSETHARTFEEIKKSKTLKVAVDGSTPGFNFYKGKELTGFEVELVTEIANRLGLKIEWKVQPFDSLLIAVNQDRFDLIATSFAMTPARSEAVDFIHPHYCTGAVIVSMPNGPKKSQDLKDKTIVVPMGTVYFDHVKKLPGIKEVRTVTSETLGLQSLLSHKADAWVTEKFVAIEAIKVHAKSGIQIGEMMTQQTNAMVVSKGNEALKKAIDEIMNQLFDDGFHSKLSHKYFNQEIRCP